MSRADKSRSEPEIIPPDHAARGRRRSAFAARGTERVYVTRLGPFGSMLVVPIAAILLVVLLALLLGMVLFIWLPLLGLIIAVTIVAAMLRAFFGRVP
jgi:hypothetical protein